jgi:amino acid adenylation domain-containing protein
LSQSPNEVAGLPIQYADYAEWFCNQLTGDKYEKHLEYWAKQLNDVPPLDFPTQRTRGREQQFDAGTVAWHIPTELTSNIKKFTMREQVTPFVFLLTSLYVLLFRYSGQDDISIGANVAGRSLKQLETLIGFFVNTIVLRGDLSGNPNFLQLLRRVRKTTIDGFKHQDIPFERVVEAVKPERMLNRNPLYQVVLSQHMPDENFSFAGINVERPQRERMASPVDMEIYIGDTESGMSGEVVYSKTLFDEVYMQRLAANYVALLTEIIENPDLSLSEYVGLSAQERDKLNLLCHGKKVDYPRDQCIHSLFAQQVDKTPNSVALAHDHQSLTFQELNDHANRLAHYLRHLRVKPGNLVGVYLDRSLDQVIAILSVLKAGGAYVPLDPDFPLERIRFMLSDSGAKVLIAQDEESAAKLGFQGSVVHLDTKRDEIGAESGDNPEVQIPQDSAAYIIYTSGSTGVPKGVIGRHHGAINRFNWMWRTYPFDKNEVCCLKTRISFVDSVWELFGPLLRGVQVVLIADEVVQDPGRFVRFLSSNGVTRLVLVPSLLRAMLDNGSNLYEHLKKIEIWTTSGEILSYELYRSFRKKLPRARLLNLYGSSEVSADVTAAELTSDRSRRYVSLGRPIDNTDIYILDKYKNPVPIGVQGEIYVGGEALAQGYHNRPELTADQFTRNPFSEATDALLFKTGDLALFEENGEIQFRGRADSQVKLRGFRIELNEVQAVLESIEEVQTAVVIAKDNPYEHLVAFYTAGGVDLQKLDTKLREHARSRLPAYMVPSHFNQLSVMPLTPSGKIDRLALLNYENKDAGTASTASRIAQSEMEQRLTELWQEVLQVKTIYIDDNFFDLGGHSLLAVDLISRTNKAFDATLPVATLFEAPTISEIANHLDSVNESQVRRSLVQIKQGKASLAPLFLVHDVDGEAILYHGLAYSVNIERPVYVLRPFGTSECPILHTRIEDMAAHYIEEIKELQPEGPYLVGGLCAGGVVAFEMACQLQEKGDDVPLVAIIDALEVTTKPLRGKWRSRLSRFVTDTNRAFQQKNLGQKEKSQKTNVVGVALRKIANVIIYEIVMISKNLYERIKVNRFDRYLSSTRPVPQSLKHIPVATIYRVARKMYTPRIYQGQLVLFRATKATLEPNLSFDDTPVKEKTNEPTFGWNKRASGGVHAEDIPGGHSTMLQAPNVNVLGNRIEAFLRQK